MGVPLWLKVNGQAGRDDFGIASDYRLVISRRVLDFHLARAMIDMLCLELLGHGDALEEKSNDAIPDLSSATRLPPAEISTGEDDLDSARIEARQFYDLLSPSKANILDMVPRG